MSENSRRLTQDLDVSPPARYNFTSPKIRKESIHRPKNEWTISWDLTHQQEFYGKTIEQQNDLYGTSLTYRTHYIPALDTDTRTDLTPKKLTPSLRPCPGSRDSIIQLLEISKNFSLQNSFIFYTDGSFSRLDNTSSSPTQMGFAWVEISSSQPYTGLPPPSFKGALSFNPSSTKAEIYALLSAIITVPNNSTLDAIERFTLLSPITSNNSMNHPLYLIIHQLIPQDLYNLVHSFTFNDKTTRKIIWDFLSSFHEHIYRQIWPQHCSLLRTWERRNGITTKQKRNYRRNNRKPTSLPSPQPTRPSALNNIIFSTQDPRQLRRQRTPPTLDGSDQRPVHPWLRLSPSNRPSSLPRIPMWLILCTCNFLHSGGWSAFIRHPTSLELDLDNFSSCNFNFNFFSSFFSLDPLNST
ncbi:hypothetical protein RhiirA4_426077 [Rhizophagus irregularis]|uniref:RNase H type-1 domain-containing protein n=1 Tax=Rhizophagus irregularis TaxID=588596 RepID=A0A2I1H3V6_9GLOM|nr:hypothetical protein RhiirA4_426077 [Rhizophagus irregularis]